MLAIAFLIKNFNLNKYMLISNLEFTKSESDRSSFSERSKQRSWFEQIWDLFWGNSEWTQSLL